MERVLVSVDLHLTFINCHKSLNGEYGKITVIINISSSNDSQTINFCNIHKERTTGRTDESDSYCAARYQQEHRLRITNGRTSDYTTMRLKLNKITLN